MERESVWKCLHEPHLLHVFRFGLCYIVGSRSVFIRLAKNLNISQLIYISFFPILHKIPLNISQPTVSLFPHPVMFHAGIVFHFVSKIHVHVLKMCKLYFWRKKQPNTFAHNVAPLPVSSTPNESNRFHSSIRSYFK